MTRPNAAWLFYKRYYREIDFTIDPNDRSKRGKEDNERNARRFEAATEPLWQVELPPQPYDPFQGVLPDSQTLEAATLYPGLLLGSGYQHQTGHQGELKLGFFFDHATGLPVIPGSSVKGMLRSCFAYPQMIRDLLNQPGWTDPQVEQLELEIFGDKPGKRNPDLKAKPLPLRDTFFDALPVDSQNADRRLFDEDFLTHHNPRLGEAGKFKEPVPIAFLKVKAGIVYRFRFQLFPCEALGITAQQKFTLFWQLIELFGLGAKTNSGYGQFASKAEAATLAAGPGEGSASTKGEIEVVEPEDLPTYSERELKAAYKRGDKLVGLVRDNTNKQLVVALRLEGEIIQSTIRFPGSAAVKLGARVKLKVTNPGNPDRKQVPAFGFAGYDR